MKNDIKSNNKLQLKPQENHAVHHKAINTSKYKISVVRIVPASEESVMKKMQISTTSMAVTK